jgi:hypothetical protein
MVSSEAVVRTHDDPQPGVDDSKLVVTGGGMSSHGGDLAAVRIMVGELR